MDTVADDRACSLDDSVVCECHRCNDDIPCECFRTCCEDDTVKCECFPDKSATEAQQQLLPAFSDINPRNSSKQDAYRWFKSKPFYRNNPFNRDRSTLVKSTFPENVTFPDRPQYGRIARPQFDPRFRTSCAEYGYYPPAPWHVPLNFYPKKSKFTEWHGGYPNGNWRNLGVNVSYCNGFFDDLPNEFRILRAQKVIREQRLKKAQDQ